VLFHRRGICFRIADDCSVCDEKRDSQTLPSAGTEPFGDGIELLVWDSTSELRYLVLPERPAGTQDWDEERLASIVTRNSMIGTDRDLSPDGAASNSAAIGQGNSASKSGLEENARAAAEEFEAVFLTTMLEGMFEGVKTDGPFGGGSAEKTYRSLLVTEYAKQMSQNGGLGISDQITRDLIALQEGAQR